MLLAGRQLAGSELTWIGRAAGAAVDEEVGVAAGIMVPLTRICAS